MRTFTQFPSCYSYGRKALALLTAFLIFSFSALTPKATQAQACVANSFTITNVESGVLERDNAVWTYLIFFVKNTNQNAISHMSFTLPTSGGCAPTYLNTVVTGWARGSYSTTKPVDPITNSLTMTYGKDNSCEVTKQQDVLKIGQQEIDKANGMWVRLELKGYWTFDNDATINFKYGNACCTQALGTTGGGSGFFGCYWDCALELSANYTNILCFGGSTTVTAVVTGAEDNPAVQYRIDGGQWQTSPVFAGVLAGQHKIDAKQGPCTATYTFNVTQPSSAVGLALSKFDVKCYGAQTGSITATGSGGTPPYQFRIEGGQYGSNNVFEGLGAGTYSVYIKDNNQCEASASITITQPDAAVGIQLQKVDVLCYGETTGSITATGSGGVEPYEFKLNGGAYGSSNVFNNLGAGTFTVYIKDANECEASASITITQPDAAVGVQLQKVDVLCYGEKTGSITATGSGGVEPYEFKLNDGDWGSSNMFSGLGAGTYTVYIKDANECEASASITITQPDAAVGIQLQKVDVLCYGEKTGSITATGSGGVEPYEFKLNDGDWGSSNMFSGLGAGTYTVYIKDANECEASASITITQPDAAVGIQLQKVDVLCYGEKTGSITATGSGGVEPYEFKLNDGDWGSSNIFSGLGAGTYTVYIKDANECEASASITITQPDAAVGIQLQKVDVLCYGEKTGSITATGSGGVEPYEFKLDDGDWGSSNVFSGLGAGTYTVYIKDANECEASASITITQPDAAVGIQLQKVDVLCYGEKTGSITATGSGGVEPYEFKLDHGDWGSSNIFSGLGAGTFTVYIKDANECEASASITITQPDAAVGVQLRKVDVLCYGETTGSITATGSGGVELYEFKLNDGDWGSSNIFSGLGAGTYTVYIKDANECEASASITITQPDAAVGLDLVTVNVDCYNTPTGSITATGFGGVEPYEFKLNDGEWGSSNVFNGLGAGTYTVYIKDGNECVTSKTIGILQPGSSVALSLSQNDVACYGANTGSITASGSGGVDPYTYRLGDAGEFSDNNIFIGLIAGTYTVYVKDDNGCITYKNATLVEPGAPVSLELEATDVKCFGEETGSIKAQASGGSGDYEYKLEGGDYSSENEFKGLKAGSYTVYVKDKNDCETSKQITIEQPESALGLTLTPTDILCNGAKTGSIKVEGSGGTPDYKYQLEDGGFGDIGQFDNLPPSTYTVYIQDANGCEASDQVTINEPPALQLELKTTDVLCKGYESGIIEATGSGGTGTLLYKLDGGSYSGLSKFENLVAGTYTVYVMDENSCTASKQAVINEPATSVSLEAKADKEKVCTDEKTTVTLTATGGTPPYKYQYDNGAPGDTYVFNLGAGTHQFTVTDNNGCEAKTSVTILSEVCGNFCTYTQGYFGNDEGLSTNPGGGGNASYKDGENCVSSRVNNTIKFALASPSLPANVGNIPTNSLTADEIITFLPGGGPSGLFTGIKLPLTTTKNALLAQLLTLALNMGLNPELADFTMPSSGELWTQKAGACGTGSSTSSCTKFSFNAGKGWTVKDIYDAASNALTSISASNSERSAWTSTLDAINRGFDECARVCEPVVDPAMLLADLVEAERPRVEALPALKAKAYPNPFTDRIFINFTSPVSGKAVVEIFDMSGRRLAEINKGQVTAYTENKVEYMVPVNARSAIIYKVTVGKYTLTGRMIAPTR